MKTIIVAAGAALVAAMAAQGQQPSAPRGLAGQKPSTAAPAQRPAPTPALQAAANNRMVVYKSPTCGCCAAWITYVRRAGFQVEVHDVADLTEIKRSSGVPQAGESCHTAQVGGYFVEGHVPVEDIRRMLSERPDIRGIAVPGMPAGSPGMEVPGGRADRYQVKAVRRDGTAFVFATH